MKTEKELLEYAAALRAVMGALVNPRPMIPDDVGYKGVADVPRTSADA